MENIKNTIYNEINSFINYFISDDIVRLSKDYDISEEVLEEMNEIIYENVTSNKNKLSLFPVADIDKSSNSKDYLSLDIGDNEKFYIVECDIWVDGEPSDLILVSFYHLDDFYPKLEFRYFSI